MFLEILKAQLKAEGKFGTDPVQRSQLSLSKLGCKNTKSAFILDNEKKSE